MLGSKASKSRERLGCIVGANGLLELVEGSGGDLPWVQLLDLELGCLGKLDTLSERHSAVAQKGSILVLQHEDHLILVEVALLNLCHQ